STWQYGYAGHLHPQQLDSENPYNVGCPNPFPLANEFTLTATHPGGAAGTFLFRYRQHYRSGVPDNACNPVGDGMSWRLDIANYLQGYSLASKTVAGPGVPSMTWEYAYPSTAY